MDYLGRFTVADSLAGRGDDNIGSSLLRIPALSPVTEVP
jgi:hypothetical protein